MREGFTDVAVSSTASKSVRPPIRWRTLGSVERMREPIPAARTTTRGGASEAGRTFRRAEGRRAVFDFLIEGAFMDAAVAPVGREATV